MTTDKNNAASDVQPVELAEPQGDAPEIEQLRNLVSSILSTVSLGHQTGPYAYAGEDFGRYLREATSDCRTILRMLPTLAASPAQGIDLGQQQDAARWRWVREQNGVTVSVEEADDDGDMAFVSGHTPEQLDAAIDGQRDAAPGVGNG